jgi:hypothetical protein
MANSYPTITPSMLKYLLSQVHVSNISSYLLSQKLVKLNNSKITHNGFSPKPLTTSVLSNETRM